MKFLSLIRKIQKGKTYLVMFVVGCGFLLFTLLPLLFSNWTTDSSPLMSIIFALLGIALIAISVINLKKVVTTSLDEANYYNKVEKDVDPELVEKVRLSTSPVNDYYFHFCGKLNQSYILETLDREPIYEFICDKMGVVSQYVFTFKNHLTGEEATHNVSHTQSVSYGSDNFSLVDSSDFKIDGENIWKKIGEMGYSVDPYLDGVAFSFRIRHYGIEVAELKAAGTNILEQYEGKEGIRNLPMQGLYKVNCRLEDIEPVAIVAFAVSRTEII